MNQPEQPQDATPIDASLVGAPQTMRRLDSQQLLQGAKEILIQHNGEWYRLTVTRNDKLILHK